MKPSSLILISILFGISLLGIAIQFFPEIDLYASGLFYKKNIGFALAENPVLSFLHELATTGSRILGIALCGILVFAAIRKSAWNIPARTWLFLLCMLLIGPGLVANALFKDNWGRARPREVSTFGGNAAFTPPLIPQPSFRANGSFVAGDAAFGFSLPAFAVIAPPIPGHKKTSQTTGRKPRPWSKWIFWAGITTGFAFGYTRLAMGAHFLSDVIFAMMIMLAVMALLQTAFYGKRTTLQYWRCWLGISSRE
ncbi:MAG: phosphatase PAP2 family protein [Bdellovibrionales bacterium]